MKPIVLILFLTGCTHFQAPHSTEVQIPVPVSCVNYSPTKPELVTDEQLAKMNPPEFVTSLHIDRQKRIGYEAELETVIEGCK